MFCAIAALPYAYVISGEIVRKDNLDLIKVLWLHGLHWLVGNAAVLPNTTNYKLHKSYKTCVMAKQNPFLPTVYGSPVWSVTMFKGP